jgi:catechol 2,3-dioxygenase-like lactoylglutathione lyase family enzyme
MLAADNVMCVIPTTDAGRARAFFEGVLGTPVEVDDGFALVLRGKNASIRVTKVQEFQPLPFTLMGWEVEDIDRKVPELAARGVAFEQFPGVEQDSLGIWTVPGGGAKVAWFKDPDGNLLSLPSH